MDHSKKPFKKLIKIMVGTSNKTRSNSKTGTEIDKILIAHLLSENRHEGPSFLHRQGIIHQGSPKIKNKVKNRLGYLKRIQATDYSTFVDFCHAHQLAPTNLLSQKQLDFELEDTSSNLFDTDNEEDEQENIPPPLPVVQKVVQKK
jgi:hypothetical protein